MTEYIRTPDGCVYLKSECEIFYDEDDLLDENKQKILADELFKNTGILVADVKGGENKNNE